MILPAPNSALPAVSQVKLPVTVSFGEIALLTTLSGNSLNPDPPLPILLLAGIFESDRFPATMFRLLELLGDYCICRQF